MLVHHAEASARQRQREHRDDGRAGAQRQRGDGGSGRRRPVEKVHVEGVGGLDVLIDQDGDRLVVAKRPQDAPDGAAAVDHGVSRPPAHPFEQVVQQRVVERPREQRHRLQHERVHEGVDLPVAEVSREEQRPLPHGMRRLDAILPFELHAGQHLLGAHRAELEEHREQPSEVREHVAGDRGAFLRGPRRERRLEIAQRQLPVRPVDRMKRAPENGSRRQDNGHRQRPDDRARDHHREVFDPVLERGATRRQGHRRGFAHRGRSARSAESACSATPVPP